MKFEIDLNVNIRGDVLEALLGLLQNNSGNTRPATTVMYTEAAVKEPTQSDILEVTQQSEPVAKTKPRAKTSKKTESDSVVVTTPTTPAQPNSTHAPVISVGQNGGSKDEIIKQVQAFYNSILEKLEVDYGARANYAEIKTLIKSLVPTAINSVLGKTLVLSEPADLVANIDKLNESFAKITPEYIAETIAGAGL